MTFWKLFGKSQPQPLHPPKVKQQTPLNHGGLEDDLAFPTGKAPSWSRFLGGKGFPRQKYHPNAGAVEFAQAKKGASFQRKSNCATEIYVL